MPSASDVVITYDGTDITGYVMFAQSTFELQMSAVPGTFEIRCKDVNQELSFVTGKELTLDVDGVRMYGGIVGQVGRTYAFSADHVPATPANYKNRIWVIRGVDFNKLLDARVLRRTANYLKRIPTITGGVFDGELIRDHLSDYIDDPPGMDFDTFVDDIKTYDPYVWPTQGTTVRKFLEDLTQFTGALTYVDGDKALHHHEIDTTVKRWGFSDVPNHGAITASPAEYQGSTIGMREITGIEDGSGFVNDAFVWGGSMWAGSGSTVFARETDSGQISTHGRWQLAETHFGELGYGVQSGVDTRADLIVNGSPGAVGGDQNRGLKYPQWQFRLAWFAHDVPLLSGDRNHIVPGELTTFRLWVFSEDAGVTPLTQLLPLRSVRISFPTLDPAGDSYVRFDGFFGLQLDDPYTLWRFILKQRRKIISASLVETVDNSADSAPYGAYYQDEPSPTADGIETVFTIPFRYIAGTTALYDNRLRQIPGTDYDESDPETGEITFSSAPAGPLWMECRVAG